MKGTIIMSTTEIVEGHQITSVGITDIVVGERLRSLNAAAVAALKNSISKIGLRVPISVHFSEERGPVLVTGRHRLQACIELGWKRIPVHQEEGSELDARLWEIAENLHRAELTALEKAGHIAEWIRLVDEREAVSAQVAPKLSARGRAGEGRPESGVKAAARKLGIERTEAQRAVKIDALTPEAKAEAVSLRLDGNQAALLRAQRAGPTQEQQIEALKDEAVRRSVRNSKGEAKASEAAGKAEDEAFKSLMAAWRANPNKSARRRFLDEIAPLRADRTVPAAETTETEPGVYVVS